MGSLRGKKEVTGCLKQRMKKYCRKMKKEKEKPDSWDRLQAEKKNKRKRKYCKTLCNPYTVCLMSICLLLTLFISLGWVFHVIFPATKQMEGMLPESEEDIAKRTIMAFQANHRVAYQSNSFIRMLHSAHEVVNNTDCWICGLLPPTVEKGLPFIPLPFSRNGSCNAWHFYVTLWVIAAALKFEGGSSLSEPLDVWSQLNRTCCINGEVVNGTQMERDEYRNFNSSIRKIHRRELKENKGTAVPVTVSPLKVPLCIKGSGKIRTGDSECDEVIVLNMTMSPAIAASMNSYFVCGDQAYLWLPAGWSGTCYIAFLLPPVYAAPSSHHETYAMQRTKRGVINAEDTAGQEFEDFLIGIMPFWGPVVNSRHIRQLTRVLEATINTTAGALANLTAEVQAERLVTLQNRMVLDIILADRGGVCQVIGSSCCVYIPDNAPNVYKAIQKLHVIAESIHQQKGVWSLTDWIWSFVSTWGWRILLFIAAGVVIFLSCCLCVQCAPAICGLCISALTPRPVNVKKRNEQIMLQQEVCNLMSIDID